MESISPRNGMTEIGAMAPISVEFSSAISTRSPMPTLAPTVPGSWRISGKTVTFTPGEPFVPLSHVALTVPGTSDGMLGKSGETLAASVVDNFAIENGATLRLQQLLSLLDYSPLSWSPDGAAISPDDTAAQLAAVYKRHRGASPGGGRHGPPRSRGSGIQEPSTSSPAGS